MLSNIDVGCLVEITVVKDEASGTGNTYASRVTDVSQVFDKKISISTPKYYEKYIKVDVGSPCNFLFLQGNSMLECSGNIEEIKPNNQLGVKIIGLVKSVQRRSYSRVTVVIPFDFFVLEKDSEDKPKLVHGVVKDISSGGMRFVTNTEISSSSKIKVHIDLDDDYIATNAEILSSKKFPRSNYKYQYRVHFVETPNIDLINIRSRIKKFIDNNTGQD